MATGVLSYITEILRSGKDLLFVTNNRLPPEVEKTLPAAIGRNVPNGVAATNADGLPVDTAGRPMAVIGTVAGTAADSKTTADALNKLAPLDSPVLTGTPKATTAVATDVSLRVATTEFVKGAVTAVADTIPAQGQTSRNLFPAGSPLAWPPRPAWSGPVVFNAKGQAIAPPGNDGQVTGGGGMVPLLDEYRT